MKQKFEQILFVLASLVALLPLPQVKTNPVRIYEDDFFHVDDATLDDNGGVERIFAPNELSDETLNHGYIQLNNVDHIAVPCMKLMLSTLFLQEIHKPKRVLVTGLGIGIIPRALNFLLGDTLHIDVVEIGRIAFNLEYLILMIVGPYSQRGIAFGLYWKC